VARVPLTWVSFWLVGAGLMLCDEAVEELVKQTVSGEADGGARHQLSAAAQS